MSTNTNSLTGQILANGHLCIASKEVKEGEHVVLAFRPNHPVDKWVTWLSENNGTCYSGNYFSSIVEAVEDWGKRTC